MSILLYYNKIIYSIFLLSEIEGKLHELSVPPKYQDALGTNAQQRRVIAERWCRVRFG